MSNLTITVDHLQRGQPRPYAPHTYESHITIEGKRSWDGLTEEQVRDLTRTVVHYWQEEGEGDWASPRLVRLERIEKVRLTEDTLGPQREVWAVRVEQPYTD